MDKRTVALGVAALAAVAAALIVTLTNHKHRSPNRDAAAAYIRSVDSVQQRMRVQLTKTAKAYRDFAEGKSDPGRTAELAKAEANLRLLQRRLQALPAPVVATKLRRLLLDLAAANVTLAGEVARLATFAPKFNALLRESKAAGTRLSAGLRAVTPPTPHTIRGSKKQVAAEQAAFQAKALAAAAEQASVVDRYDAEIAAIRRRMAKLVAPPVMRPALRTELSTLEATKNAGLDLAQELRKTDRSRVATYGRRFTVAARAASSESAQRAQIAAIKAYNQRVRAIGSIQTRIQAEVGRLQRTAD
jgi:hypothetical protein